LSITKDKMAAKRSVYFARLIDHPEKANRLDLVRNNVYRYLSLDPHGPEYKGLHFSRSDAIFATTLTLSIISNLLEYLKLYESQKKVPY
jgi:hypothetical protein